MPPDSAPSAVVIDRLLEVGIRRRYPPRTFLFHEGDSPTSVYVIERGLVRVERSLSTGRTLLLTLSGPGSWLGELGPVDDEPRSATAFTVYDSRLIVVPAHRFIELIGSDPEVSQAVLRTVTSRLRALTNQLVEATSLAASARVAARLLDLVAASEASPDQQGVIDLRLPVTQEELAQWAGLSREGAVKGLGELRAAGVLETGRRRVRVLDLGRLQSAASKPAH